MDIRILLVAREAKIRSVYHEAIKALGVKVVAVPLLIPIISIPCETSEGKFGIDVALKETV